jgi:hypothetical protein
LTKAGEKRLEAAREVWAKAQAGSKLDWYPVRRRAANMLRAVVAGQLAPKDQAAS